jgi:hypothetical protein
VIFQDAVQHFGGNPSIDLFTADLMKMISDRGNHPSIVQWDIFNEGDCIRAFLSQVRIPLLAWSHPWTICLDDCTRAQRLCVRTALRQDKDIPKRLVDLVKRADPTRTVDTNSGGPGNSLGLGDVFDIHDYPQPKDPKPSATQVWSSSMHFRKV